MERPGRMAIRVQKPLKSPAEEPRKGLRGALEAEDLREPSADLIQRDHRQQGLLPIHLARDLPAESAIKLIDKP